MGNNHAGMSTAAPDDAETALVPIRLAHHTERPAFPKDGKKARAYFQTLREEYTLLWCVGGGTDVYQAELAYYREHYGATLNARNEMYARGRHTDRMINIHDMYGKKRTCPEELFIQAGGKNGKGVPNAEVFKGCIIQYLSWMQGWSMANGGHLHILNVHISSQAPYRAIIRRVWDCAGKSGLTKVSMTGALKEAGVPYPDQDVEESRYNNRKMTFDRISREALYGCFENAGIPVNREPGIHTLRQALKVKEGADAGEQYARDMLREIMAIAEQASPVGTEEDLPGMLESPDGGILIPEESYRMLRIRECLGGAYASRNRQAGNRLLDALEKEREEERMCVVQEGIRKNLELEYAVLRIGLLRCGYYAGKGEGGAVDESFPQ